MIGLDVDLNPGACGHTKGSDPGSLSAAPPQQESQRRQPRPHQSTGEPGGVGARVMSDCSGIVLGAQSNEAEAQPCFFLRVPSAHSCLYL